MNFFIRKSLFTELGGFNNNYWPGEDSKLCRDLVYKKHKTILYDPSLIVYHHRRKSLLGFLQQHANYGFHRGAFFSHGDQNSRKISYLIPAFFIFYLFLLLIHPFFIGINGLFFFPLIIYLIGEFYFIFIVYLNTLSFLIAFNSAITLFLTHLVYGIMFLKGFITGLVKKENIYG